MQRVLVWMLVPWLAGCGRLAFEAAVPADGGDDAPVDGDDDAPLGGCPLVLNLDRAKIQEPLVDFPLLVRLDGAHVDRARLQADARNLEFHLDGEALAYEIEDAGDPVIAWVRVPVLSGTSLAIRVGYGAGTAAAASQPVWSPQYAAVFHLAEASGTPHDATGHYPDSSIVEFGTPPIAGMPGRIGGGREFQSQRHHSFQLDAPDLPYSAFTISGWMNETMLPVGMSYHALVTREHASDADNLFYIGDHGGKYFGEVYQSTDGEQLSSNTAAEAGKWVHLALTATTDPVSLAATLFVNGEMDVFQSLTGLPPAGTERPIVLGADNNSGAAEPADDRLDGILDEVRIETVARSREWVRADYLSMSDQLIRYEVMATPVPCD